MVHYPTSHSPYGALSYISLTIWCTILHLTHYMVHYPTFHSDNQLANHNMS